MDLGPFEESTLLDLTVNAIPLGIMLFFAAVFVVLNYWEPNLIITAIALGLIAIPFLFLALLTYVAGLAIQRDESEVGEEDSNQAEDARSRDEDARDRNENTPSQDEDARGQ